MYASVLITLINVVFVLSFTVNIKTVTMDKASETQIPLEPLVITCSQTDIIIIAAPVVAGRVTRYYLTNPKGIVKKLNLAPPHYKIAPNTTTDVETIAVIFKNGTKILSPVNDYQVFNVNFGHSDVRANTEDTFGERERRMAANEFMIGPVSEDDHGNWEISAFYKDAGEWIEVYKTITLDIQEVVPAKPKKQKLKPGETLKIGFAYAIPNLETCQLIVPKSSFDKFYDRDLAKMDRCGYVVKNINRQDSGLWQIIGVGRISYLATVQVTVE